MSGIWTAGVAEFSGSTERETIELGMRLADELPRAAVVVLTGPLGSGKTTLARGVCRRLGCEDQMSSPSFAIINVYDGERTVYHCDLYRLQTLAEIIATGFEEVLYSDGVVLVEWAERAISLLPVPRYEASCSYDESGEGRHFVWQLYDGTNKSLLDGTGIREVPA
jgi:tRNA threonylcarbamoyladenosine biosynthesis protein TsaE